MVSSAKKINPDAVEDIGGRLLNEVHRKYNFARHTFHDLNRDQLERAYLEARELAGSGLFNDEIYPDVSVDPYGEFTFSHRSDAGYVDIGVRGESELSYAVRNDKAQQETRFDDHDWRDRQIPQDLFKALKALGQSL